MDVTALFRVQCGLYVASVAYEQKMNGCITNTLMQQSHVPVQLSLTLQKDHLTHDMLLAKKSVGVSALSHMVTQTLVKHFGFQSGRDVNKFADFAEYALDANGNPLLTGEQIAAVYSLRVYDTVDVGTHTMFLCRADDAASYPGKPITYWDYRETMKK